MAQIKRNLLSLIIPILVVGITYALLQANTEDTFSELRNRIARKEVQISGFKSLLEDRLMIEKKWEEKKYLFHKQMSDDQVLNLWVRDLIAYGENEGIVFEKIEPKSTFRYEDQNEIKVFLMFQGTIRKLIRLFLHLYENDAASVVKDIVIRHPKDAKQYQYELSLIKGVGK